MKHFDLPIRTQSNALTAAHRKVDRLRLAKVAPNIRSRLIGVKNSVLPISVISTPEKFCRVFDQLSIRISATEQSPRGPAFYAGVPPDMIRVGMRIYDKTEIQRQNAQLGEPRQDQVVNVFRTSRIQKKSPVFPPQNRKIQRASAHLSFQKKHTIK
jgi:hypothetical protein